MAQTITDELKYMMDILVWMPDDRFRFYVTTATLYCPAAAAAITTDIDDLIGYPLKLSGGNYELLLSGDEANVTHIIVGICDGSAQSIEAADLTADSAVSTDKYFVIGGGPAELLKEMIETTDIEGATIAIADIETALNALDIKLVTGPVETETQTT